MAEAGSPFHRVVRPLCARASATDESSAGARGRGRGVLDEARGGSAELRNLGGGWGGGVHPPRAAKDSRARCLYPRRARAADCSACHLLMRPVALRLHRVLFRLECEDASWKAVAAHNSMFDGAQAETGFPVMSPFRPTPPGVQRSHWRCWLATMPEPGKRAIRADLSLRKGRLFLLLRTL